MVKVDSSTPVRSSSPSRRAKKSPDASKNFSVSESASESEGQSQPIAQAEDIKSVESLLSVQEVPENLTPEQKSYRRGTILLDQLEHLRLSILTGDITPVQLQALKDIANDKNHIPSNNPELEKTRRLIEQRARVELAKIEK